MAEIELKPCPFCGGGAEMGYYMRPSPPDIAGLFVECASCSAGGEGFDVQGEMPDRIEHTKSKAIAAWNTRPAADQLAAQSARIEELEAERDALQTECAAQCETMSRQHQLMIPLKREWNESQQQAERYRRALEAILDATSVGQHHRPVNDRSAYGNYPAKLYHRARTALTPKEPDHDR